MNIFKTFEMFLREPLSILKDRIIQIVNVQSGDPSQFGSISAEFLDKKTQITVFNSDRMYTLLQTVMYKKKLKEEQGFLESPQKQVVIGQLLKRQ